MSYKILGYKAEGIRQENGHFTTGEIEVRIKTEDGREETRTFKLGQTVYLDEGTIHRDIPVGTKGEIVHLQVPMYDSHPFLLGRFSGHPIDRNLKLEDVVTELVTNLPLFQDATTPSQAAPTHEVRPLWQ